MPEISQQELNLLRSAHALMDQLMGHPKTKRDIQKLVKTIHPNVTTDDELAEPLVGPIKEELNALKKWKQEQEDAKIEAQFTGSFSQLKKDGWTDEGIEKLKKLMVDRQIPDVDAAAALFEKQNPPERELAPAIRSNDWNIGDKDDDKYKRLLDDPDRFARDEAAKVLNEVQKNGRPDFGAEQFGWGQPR